MDRKIRTLFVTLLALAALAIVADGAAAKGVIVTGGNTGEDELVVGPAALKCASSGLEGTVSEEELAGPSGLTLKPTFSECKYAEGEAHVSTNDCAYVLSTTTDSEGNAPLSIECEAGSKIEIDVTGLCTLTIGEQTPVGGVHYTDLGGGVVKISTSLEEVNVEKTKTTASQFFCALVSTGKIGTLDATSEIKCFQDEGEGPQEDPTTPTGTEEGEAVACPLFQGGTAFTGEDLSEEVFAIGGINAKCTTSVLEGTVSAEEEGSLTKLTLKPTYGNESGSPSGCTYNGGEAHFRTNDCAFVFGSKTNAEGHAPVEIECKAGHKIEMDVTNYCTVTIGAQTPPGGAHYTVKEGGSIEVNLTLKQVVIGKAKTTESQVACVLVPTGAVGNLKGIWKLKCFEDESVVPSPNPTTPHLTGEGKEKECPFEVS